ncbi:YfiR family protein [Oryzomonas japonica]|uniref:YfiR family protein n=1 Tax=Oryzomonas japonica TaxID=2603858 RepID=A0A7J4ZT58_9BACT|nr:YfiR family protein [Oryzomonas japonica]KAB0666591.1 YfiR family protein [Oryzomonas japonica]
MAVLRHSCPQQPPWAHKGGRYASFRRGRRIGWGAIVGTLVLAGSTFLFVATAHALPGPPSEYQIKAAMVFTMAKFVEWPAGALGDEGTPLALCALGIGPFGQAVENLRGKSIKGHPITVRQIFRTGEIGGCQILVINDSQRRQVRAATERAAQHGVLTIGDMPGFAKAGGVVGFVVQEGKVRFEINLEAAQKSGFMISSRVLKLAKIVREEEQ